MLYGRPKKSSFSCRLRKRAWILAVNNWYSKDFIANIFVSWILNLLWGFFLKLHCNIQRPKRANFCPIFFSRPLWNNCVPTRKTKRRIFSIPGRLWKKYHFFNWKENEPSTHDRDVYIRTTAANYALMEVSTGSTYKNFICFVM